MERICNSSYNFDLYLWVRIMSDELERILKLSRKIEFQSGGRILHQVKVFDKNGKLLKIIPGEELESKHWSVFLNAEDKLKQRSWSKKKKNVSTRKVSKPLTVKQLKIKNL